MTSAGAAAPSTAFHRAMILAGMTMATSLVGMSLLVVSVVLPKLQGTLSASQDQIAWVVTFNVLPTAVGMPMTGWLAARFGRSEEHTSELQSLMRISFAVFCLKKKTNP